MTPPDGATAVDSVEIGDGGDVRFRWEWLVARVLHPIQVAMIEALLWIDLPIAPSDIARMHGGEHSASHIGYHANKLAALGVLEVTNTEGVRGGTRHLYVLTPESTWG